MDSRERGSHVRGVYPTQATSRMGPARVKQTFMRSTLQISREPKTNNNHNSYRYYLLVKNIPPEN